MEEVEEQVAVRMAISVGLNKAFERQTNRLNEFCGDCSPTIRLSGERKMLCI